MLNKEICLRCNKKQGFVYNPISEMEFHGAWEEHHKDTRCIESNGKYFEHVPIHTDVKELPYCPYCLEYIIKNVD